MTPTSRAELERLAEACERAGQRSVEYTNADGVTPLRAAARVLRSLATVEAEVADEIEEALDAREPLRDSTLQLAALLLRASASTVRDERDERLMHALYHIRGIECSEDHDASMAPCPRRIAKEAIDNRPCSICARGQKRGEG